MSRRRRRRALVLLCLSLSCGGLAASQVSDKLAQVEGRVGAPVAVLVTARDIPAGEELAERHLAVREVPSRYVPADSLASAADAVGSAPATPLPKGAYVTASALGAAQAGRGGPAVLRRGERAVEVAVAGGAALAGETAPGSRVDVLVSTEPREGPGRTFLAIEGVELLDLRLGGDATAAQPEEGEGAATAASALATLRVTLRQAVYLTAAQNFAREVRLLPRPAGDRSRTGRAGVAASEL